jgi:iron complex transport system ATP-binding protein
LNELPHHALDVRDLRFGYPGGREVLPGLNHTFSPGRVCAIIGPNGAGKSTLLRLLAGVLRPDAGEVLVGGEPVRTLRPAQRAKRLVYIPQRSGIAFPFSVRQVVAMGRYAAGETASAPAVQRALDASDLSGVADAPVGTLSFGQQQRVTLARALAQVDRGDGQSGAAALLADEPVSSLDPAHAVRTMEVIRSMAARGLCVVVVLHDLSLVLRWADDVVLLDARGRIAHAGPSRTTLTAGAAAEIFGIGFEPLSDGSGSLAGLIPGRAPEPDGGVRNS